MIFIGEIQKPARYTTLLEDVEQGQSFGDGETVVLVAVDDELGGAELEDVFCGRRVPAEIVVSVIPDGAVELFRDC